MAFEIDDTLTTSTKLCSVAFAEVAKQYCGNPRLSTGLRPEPLRMEHDLKQNWLVEGFEYHWDILDGILFHESDAPVGLIPLLDVRHWDAVRVKDTTLGRSSGLRR